VPGSLSEKRFVDINGSRQGMIVKSRNRANPLLLYLHGGMPDYFLTAAHPTGLENLFTVVWWDQRGAGLSYRPGIDTGGLSRDVLAADTIALAEDLRRTYRQEQVYLLAHSGGTFVGVEAIARRPDLFRAYIAVAQVVDQAASERLAHAYMVQAYRDRGDERAARRLAAVPVDLGGDRPSEYLRLRDRAMHELGVGTTRDMRSVVSGLLWPSLWFDEYTVHEKLNLWRGKAATGVSAVWREMVSTDLARSAQAFATPMYFFHGVHDYTCSYPLARSYAGRVQAPVKGFYSFQASAHSPIFEEPARCLQILREDVLQRRADLADRD
jgi:pimeloyl-ACP methyl ester carboxylesterase